MDLFNCDKQILLNLIHILDYLKKLVFNID